MFVVMAESIFNEGEKLFLHQLGFTTTGGTPVRAIWAGQLSRAIKFTTMQEASEAHMQCPYKGSKVIPLEEAKDIDDLQDIIRKEKGWE